jgi:hypothetical protein
MPNPIVGLVMIGLGVALFFAFDFVVMTGALMLAGLVWTGMSIVERIARRPTRDNVGNFHSGTSGQFISRQTFVSTYLGIGVAVAMPIFTRLDTLAQFVPAFVAAPPEFQVLAAFGTNLVGWLIS